VRKHRSCEFHTRIQTANGPTSPNQATSSSAGVPRPGSGAVPDGDAGDAGDDESESGTDPLPPDQNALTARSLAEVGWLCGPPPPPPTLASARCTAGCRQPGRAGRLTAAVPSDMPPTSLPHREIATTNGAAAARGPGNSTPPNPCPRGRPPTPRRHHSAGAQRQCSRDQGYGLEL
jgi:hypothetical protein